MAIYMSWDGIDGAVSTKGFEKWIELNSFQWGVGRAIGTAARVAVNPSPLDLSSRSTTVRKTLAALAVVGVALTGCGRHKPPGPGNGTVGTRKRDCHQRPAAGDGCASQRQLPLLFSALRWTLDGSRQPSGRGYSGAVARRDENHGKMIASFR